MEGSEDRLDRVEQILREMAVRQQYHDEAFERFDARMKAAADRADESRARIDHHEQWIKRFDERMDQLTEHLVKQERYLDVMADQVNDALQRVTDRINQVSDRIDHLAVLTAEVTAATRENSIHIDKLSEAWLYHNKRINALEERQAS